MNGLKVFAKSTCWGSRILFVVGFLFLLFFAISNILYEGFVIFVFPLWYLALIIELSRNIFFKTSSSTFVVFLHSTNVISRILFGVWLFCSFILIGTDSMFFAALFFLLPSAMIEKVVNPVFEDSRRRKRDRKDENRARKKLEKEKRLELYEKRRQEHSETKASENKETVLIQTVKPKKEILEELMCEIDEMDGHEFEHLCAKLLKQNGYTKVQVTPASGDQGADIIAEKGDLKYAIQCKRYNSALNNKPIQEIGAGRVYYKCDIGVVLTNNYFNANAIDIAKAMGILLWDRKTLIKLIENSGMLDKQ